MGSLLPISLEKHSRSCHCDDCAHWRRELATAYAVVAQELLDPLERVRRALKSLAAAAIKAGFQPAASDCADAALALRQWLDDIELESQSRWVEAGMESYEARRKIARRS